VSNNDQVDFTLRLVDEVSKNAGKAEQELAKVHEVMKATGKTEAEVRKSMKSLASAEIEAGKAAQTRAKAHEDAMKRVHDASSKAASGLVEFGVASLSSLASVASGLVAAAELFALKAGEFKDKTLRAFELIDGSRSAADSTLKELTAAASSAGLPTEKITKFYTELRTAGFAAKEAKAIMSAGLDIGSILGDQKGEAFLKAVETLRSKGVASMEVLGSLKEAGIADPDAFFEALGKQEGLQGKSTKALKDMLQAGQIDADTATNAMLQLVQTKFDKGGALGSAANEMAAGSVSAQLQGLKNDVEGIFADASVKGPILEALKNLHDLLGADTESGQEIRRVLGEAFTAIGDAIGKLTPEDIEDLIDALVKTADAGAKIAKAFGGPLGKSIEKVLTPIGKLFDDADTGSGAIDALVAVLEVLSAVVGKVGGAFIESMLALPSGMAGVYDELKEIFDSIPHSWDELQEWWDDLSLVEVGENLVDGLWEGIKSTWRGMLRKFEDLLDILPEAAKKALGIASPSKVMMEIGKFAGEGFTIGLEGENDNAQQALVDLVSPPQVSTAGGAAPQLASIGRSSFSVGEVHVHVSGAGGAEAAAREFGRSFRDELERLAREMGAVA